MIRHKLPNKTKNATVAEPKLFHQLNKPKVKAFFFLITEVKALRKPVGVPPPVCAGRYANELVLHAA
jgi:hypothetical protein